ncbi:MAG: hypothetical protein ACYCZ7_01470, partial [Minisyncoccota bacterium]
MNTEEKKEAPINEEARRLIKKQIDDFERHVAKGDLSEILLKGHLLVEHYLDHAMLLFFDTAAKVHQKSFYEKIRELTGKNCFWNHS